MPRRLSVALTQDAVRARIKTQTRRAGWDFLTPGTVLTLTPKSMGLKRGETSERICDVRVTDVRKEPLDAIAEGFPGWTPADFVAFFCSHMGVKDPTTQVNVISWEYLCGGRDPAYLGFCMETAGHPGGCFGDPLTDD